MDQNNSDVAVIGGGLAGLAAATYLARDGHRVALFEKSPALGGRAMTTEHGGFLFNLGPHALYKGGPGLAVLAELGIRFTGGAPNSTGGYALHEGRKHALPGGVVSLLTTGLMGIAGKLETARLLGSIQALDAGAVQGLSVRQWLDRAIRDSRVRALVQALFRLSTYANDPDRQSAGAALAQLQVALRSNVIYIDGGWQVLVDGLRAAAETAGVHFHTACKAVSIAHDGAVRGVRLADGSTVAVTAAVIAAGPETASALAGGTHERLRAAAEGAVPVRAACLNVALTRLPRPRACFALGIDQPTYFSVHSAVARLAPAGGATVHVSKYLAPDSGDDALTHERDLESVLDLVQPGWREAVAARQFMPALLVSHALATAAAGGTSGRFGPVVDGIRNLYVAGDWVGPEGLLADASLASAKRAAGTISRREVLRAA